MEGGGGIRSGIRALTETPDFKKKKKKKRERDLRERPRHFRHVRSQWEDAVNKGGSPPDTKHAAALTLDFQPQNCEK